MKKFQFLIAIGSVFSVILPGQIATQALFTGRFDFSDPSKVVFSHVSNSIKASFNGTGISASFTALSNGASATSYFYVIVDGNVKPETRTLIKVSKSAKTSFVLASGLPKTNHTIELVKETQYDTKVAFYGFTVANGTLLAKPVNPAVLSIEYYGDSNPAGSDAYDPRDAGAVINNGGYYTYPGITARTLNADYHNISMGGVGITDRAWRNLIKFYHLVNMNDAATGNNLWDFSNYSPDVCVINASSNDFTSGATKDQIKSGWKSFTAALRARHPAAHIVIAESYGWAIGEPTDYIAETVSEINAGGDPNVSFVKFPWLWGQNHAVINEHAGFANILAKHISTVLNLPVPIPSDLSSFAPYGSVTNGSFEKTTLAGIADGWRPNGTVTLVKDASAAKAGTNSLRLYNRAWVNFANDARPGDLFTVKGWLKGAQNADLGKLKLEFKDQGQNTIGTNEGLVTLTTSWQQVTTAATAPAGTWSVWVVLVAEQRDYVWFDDIQLSVVPGGAGKAGSQSGSGIFNHPAPVNFQMNIFPNPCKGQEITISNMPDKPATLAVLDMTGKLVYTSKVYQSELTIQFKHSLKPGIYAIVRTSSGSKSAKLFLVD